ncbi:MAG: UDP-N-acetylmuramate:L-alanyl-gamma-D-glutamyl-meso-diaminopimelate ligase, partial [Gammaproteobacteria bacterium]|nr:UDP-N-acetylmuramate:L-alanyl-gamma-D-glutamyl-meso-diaminopimelate ligase [Gammaproteobacteria bacterium]
GSADWVAVEEPAGVLRVLHRGVDIGSSAWQLSGAHNAENALAALLACRAVGVEPAVAIEALGRFGGVRRRLQRLGAFAGVQLFDDFAHHPTAIRRTLEGVRRRAGVQRVIAVLEPRSNSMKLGIYQGALGPALAGADLAWVMRPAGLKWDLAAEFQPLSHVSVRDDTATIVREILAAGRPGDAVVVMSNGDFQGIHTALREGLEGRGDSGTDGPGPH